MKALLPNENSFLNECQSNSNMGIHFDLTHNKSVLIREHAMIWYTSAQDPKSLYANHSPSAPLIATAIAAAIAVVLKSKIMAYRIL